MKTQVNVKIDPSVKKKAQQRADALGLSLSSVVNATLKQFARTGTLELSVAPKMTAHLEQIIKEARKEFFERRAHGPFNSPSEMIKSLEK